MNRNPYRYTGPLDPVRDSLACVSRQDDVKKIIKGINSNEYWAILGPRQIGKTTFLRQIEKEYPEGHYAYFNFDIAPDSEEKFYKWLINRIQEEIPSESLQEESGGGEDYQPELRFFDFLLNFKPKAEVKKIVLLFDEIEKIPSLRTFLRLWRNVYHERYRKTILHKYSVLITGSVDLVHLAVGKTAPFNVAKIHYLKDFSNAESERLITDPFNQFHMEIENPAIEKLISQVSGHPQLLQHTCSKLFEIATLKKRCITVKEVDEVFKILFVENLNFDTLREDLKFDILEELVREILKGEKKEYFPYKDFSIEGAGAIVEDEKGFCSIRNELYKTFLKGLLDVGTPYKTKIPKIFIFSHTRDEEEMKRFSKNLKDLNCREDHFALDGAIIQGKIWHTEVEAGLKGADVIILLISDNFLRSDFIMRKEIPIILKQKEKEGSIIFPVLVKKCDWENVSWLNSIGVYPKDKVPISYGNATEQQERCAKTISAIANALYSQTKMSGQTKSK